MSLPSHHALTPIELASGIAVLPDQHAPTLPKPDPEISPLAALEEVIRPALRRPPCITFFSGGRDSSAVLAAAVSLARREGLPCPIPVTLRFPAAGPEMDEARWQELMISHLELDTWEKIDVVDELDCLAPLGIDVLEKHALVFPTTPHALVPALELASGGLVLTGTGGDEAFTSQSRLNHVLAGRAKPRPRDIARLALAAAPRRLRTVRARRTAPTFVDWLTPVGREQFEQMWGERQGRESFQWSRRLLSTWSSRGMQISLSAMDILARERDVLLVQPLAHPLFVSTLAHHAGWRGFANRTAAMQSVFGTVVPDEVNTRTSKAVFSQPYWTHYSQEFGRAWTGTGVDPVLVEVEKLASYWAAPVVPPAPTLTLLKSAWLATNARNPTSRDRLAEA